MIDFLEAGISFEGNHWVIFGDGHALRYYRKRTVIKDGEERVEFAFQPTKEAMAECNISDDDIDQRYGTFTNSYKKSNVHIFFDKGNESRILVTVGVTNNSTPLSRVDQDLIIRKESLDKDIEEKNKSIARINRMIDVLNQRPMQLIANDLKIMRDMKQAIPRSSEEEATAEFVERMKEDKEPGA